MTASAMSTADRLRTLAAEQMARDAWSRDQLLAHQQERLRALLAHAREHSPYYRERLDGDFASLPTLSKATLMEQWDRIVCDPRLRRDEVAEHAAGQSCRRIPTGRVPGLLDLRRERPARPVRLQRRRVGGCSGRHHPGARPHRCAA